MAEIFIVYEGNLSTRCIQLENRSELLTDAPKDQMGLGRFFSPGDLLAASLGSCMLTLMGIVAKHLNVDIQGMQAKVTKEMTSLPQRRIGKIQIEFSCPTDFSENVKAKLIHAAETCPMHKSLHPDIIVEFSYNLGNLK